jgi:hypothetical protein
MTGDVEASGKGTAVAFHCASSPSTRSVAILTPPIGVASSADCGDRQGCRTDFASRWCLRCTIRASCRTCRGLCIWDHRRKPLVPQKLCAAHCWLVRSQLSGFSQQYISGLEQGQRNPTVVTLYELALAVGAHTARSSARRAGGSVVIAAKSGAGGVCHSRYELPPLRYPIICTQVQILGVQHALPSVVREVRPTIVARFRPHHLERT